MTFCVLMAVVQNRFGIYPLVEGPLGHINPKTILNKALRRCHKASWQWHTDLRRCHKALRQLAQRFSAMLIAAKAQNTLPK